MQHTWLKHEPGRCQEWRCPICEGGLAICTVCGAAEGELTKDCCGFRLNQFILDAIYKGGLNFADGMWTVAAGIPYYIKEAKQAELESIYPDDK